MNLLALALAAFFIHIFVQVPSRVAINAFLGVGALLPSHFFWCSWIVVDFFAQGLLNFESTGETDPYKKLRELVRFEMSREALVCGKEHEVCCTESNFAMAVLKFRGELEKIVPDSQKEVLDSMAYSLYSDFTKFFVCVAFDMVADAKIYEMKEFRPLQINAMGREVRVNIKAIVEQNAKPQKSETVTTWFRRWFA